MNRPGFLWFAIVSLCVAAAWMGYEQGVRSAAGDGTGARAEARRPPNPERERERRAGSGPRMVAASEIVGRLREALGNRDEVGWKEVRRDLSNLGSEGLLSALQEAAGQPRDTMRSEMVRAILLHLAERDPSRALAEAARVLDGRELLLVRAGALREWARLDPVAALAEAVKLGQAAPREAHDYVGAVYSAWASDDFARAAGDWHELEGDGVRDAARRVLARAAAEDAARRERLWEIAEGFASDYHRDRFLAEAVRSWGAREGLAEVAAWIAAQEIDAASQAGLRRALAEEMAARDPRQTAEWLLAQSTPESRAGDLEAIVSQWAAVETQACGEWLAGEAAGPAADPAIAEYSTILARRRPGEALGWAARIQDEEARARTYRSIVRQMGPVPEEGVRRVLQEAGLPAELVGTLLDGRAAARE